MSNTGYVSKASRDFTKEEWIKLPAKLRHYFSCEASFNYGQNGVSSLIKKLGVDGAYNYLKASDAYLVALFARELYGPSHPQAKFHNPPPQIEAYIPPPKPKTATKAELADFLDSL